MDYLSPEGFASSCPKIAVASEINLFSILVAFFIGKIGVPEFDNYHVLKLNVGVKAKQIEFSFDWNQI